MVLQRHGSNGLRHILIKCFFAEQFKDGVIFVSLHDRMKNFFPLSRIRYSDATKTVVKQTYMSVGVLYRTVRYRTCIYVNRTVPYGTVKYYREFLEDFRGFVELWFGTVPVRTVPLEKNGNFSIEKFPFLL